MRKVLCLFLVHVAALAQATATTVSDASKDYVGHSAYVGNRALVCYGRIATITAIHEVPSIEPKPRFNALGERIPDQVSSEAVELFWKCDKGPASHIRETISGIPYDFKFLRSGNTADDFTLQLQEELNHALLHTAVYPQRGQRFFSIDCTLAELQAMSATKRIAFPDSPDEQMAVVATKVWKAPSGYMGLLKLQTLSGHTMFAVTNIDPQFPMAIQFGRSVRQQRPRASDGSQ